MRNWAPLWSMIVDSSLWSEPDFVCKVFLTLLALKDFDHIVRLNPYQLSVRSRKDQTEVMEALRILSSPDKRRIDNQEFEGRRIKAVEEGWLILNGEKYQEMMQKEMERARWRKAQRAQREKKKFQQNSTPSTGESAYDELVKNGASQAELDAHIERVNKEAIEARKARRKRNAASDDDQRMGDRDH